MIQYILDKLSSFPAIAVELYSTMARGGGLESRGSKLEFHNWHALCKFFDWYQEFLCPVELLYFSDQKSTIAEKW